MKRLTDYKGEEAIELWADLLEPLTKILADKEVAETFKGKSSILQMAKTVLKLHPKEISEVLLRIDPTPLTALSVVARFVDLLKEIQENDEVKGFFGFAGAESK